ncbi:hypothetical protein TRFO_08766 [Tritrichomonas foetus]|uniref:Right handed beta helix domain-containing protein n=1 Tax=Tritrichomonas foetus TaxID=1144522 RepID=A0A1J4JHV6_9EUKA|nr:hypothetical protein TRFO_08766 [Tritrichomonas foetus]|eukprot:OHS98752.1 hypothetical protein TRFO_08766 [Tritrichomonas foetus]
MIFFLFLGAVSSCQAQSLIILNSILKVHNITYTSRSSISSPYLFSPLFLGIPTSQTNFIHLKDMHFTKVSQSVFYGNFKSVLIKDSSFRQMAKPIHIESTEYFKDRILDRVTYSSTTISLINTLFEALQSNSKGGAFYSINCQVDFSHCLFSENRAPNGASIALENCHAKILFTNFSHNFAEIDAAVLYSEKSEVVFHKCTIRDCKSEKSSGSIFSQESKLTLNQCIFFQNYAEDTAGVLTLNNSILSSKDCFFMNNECKLLNSGSVASVLNSSCLYEHTSFDQNKNGIEKKPENLFSVDDRSNLTIISSSCVSNPNLKAGNYGNIVYDTSTLFPGNCPREDPTIPEIQEEFRAFIEVKSAIRSKGFIVSIILLIAVSILVFTSLPFLVVEID